MGPRLARVSVVVLAAAMIARTVDAAYAAMRAVMAVPADSLLYYNVLLTWWRHGESPRGFTLTPAPYLLDLVLELPLAVIAPDFEWFSYALAWLYAALVLGALAAVLARVLLLGRVAAALVVAAIAAVFYLPAPLWLILHAFITNHTSEIACTLGLLALVDAWFGAGARPRWWAAPAYAALVAGCAASSPFFLVTYCVPAAIAIASVARAPEVGWRRAAAFLALTAIGAVIGLLALAVLARYAWPIRSDHWTQRPAKTYRLLRDTVRADPRLWQLTLATLAGGLASTALAVIGGWRRWRVAVRFALAFYPAAIVAATAVVIKRGAFVGVYELRYFHGVWLLTCAFGVGGAVVLARRWRAARPRRAWAGHPVGVVVGGGAALALAAALVATARGPRSVFDDDSQTATTVRCLADADRAGLVHDGVGTVWVARYLNAARLGRRWSTPTPGVIVELALSDAPGLHPQENNAAWFATPFRGGAGRLDFAMTHALSDAALAALRAAVGEPDRQIICPADGAFRVDGKPWFALWIWDRPDAQRRLTELVTRDNLRAPFTPVVDGDALGIDPVWGMDTAAGAGALEGGQRVWRRADHAPDAAFAVTRAFYAPGGRYRLTLDLAAVPRAGAPADAPVAEVELEVERTRGSQRLPIRAGAARPTLELELANPGGATSGNLAWITVRARSAESLALRGMTLTPSALSSISPFQIFR